MNIGNNYASIPVESFKSSTSADLKRSKFSDILSKAKEVCVLAFSDGTPVDSLQISLVVGTILILINQYDLIAKGLYPPIAKIILTYIVPFCVSTYGAVRSKLKYNRQRLNENVIITP